MRARRFLPASFIVLAVASAIVFFAVAGAPRASALTNCDVGDYSIDSQELQFLDLINEYRAANGRGALTLSTNLNRAATWMAADMGAKRYFSHTDSTGRSASRRAQDCGYPAGAGENIAAGTHWDTAAEVFQAWQNSSGHNANMLNSSYRKIGIARVFTSGSPYGWYWVTDFGLVEDGTDGSGSSSGGSSATATPTRTATTAAPTPTATTAPQSAANITSPAPGSDLSGSSVTFSWGHSQGALQYFLYVGTSAGSNNLYGRSAGTGTSASVANLPTDGRTLHVRLWTRFSAGWTYRDVTYRAAALAAEQSSPKAELSSPAPGSTLSGSTATFQWTAGTNAQGYFIYVGSARGANDIAARSTGTSRSVSISGLPTDGRTLHVRIWTRLSSGWAYNDYTVKAAP